ncbi:hypothetical protein ACPEEZ_14825 [Frigoribacterium sp. 2-23]|uniref:hypothetical protein n=1 Tax=Frigoribacterium sp. 2-23 TaxID=3415006 RepID=UPI003C701D65
MQETDKPPRSTMRLLGQTWLTAGVLLFLAAAWPGATLSADARTPGSPGASPFVSPSDYDGVVLESHASPLAIIALLVVAVGFSVAVVVSAGRPGRTRYRVVLAARLTLVGVALLGSIFASMIVQSALLGWTSGELPADPPWWSNTSISRWENQN